MLYDGRPPLFAPPPLIMSAPAYHLVDPELCPTCGQERVGPAGRLGASVDGPDVAPFKELLRKTGREGQVVAVYFCGELWHSGRPGGAP
jgi:hypothetical protein